MLVELGCDGVILGHSERRTLFGETDALVRKKLDAALAAGLKPIVCVGETLQEREANQTWEVVGRQARATLQGLDARTLDDITIAYEPVWAINTKQTTTTA